MEADRTLFSCVQGEAWGGLEPAGPLRWHGSPPGEWVWTADESSHAGVGHSWVGEEVHGSSGVSRQAGLLPLPLLLRRCSSGSEISSGQGEC